MVHPSQQRPPDRLPPLSLAIVRRGQMRAFAIRPWIAGSVIGVTLVGLAALIGGAAYLTAYDDLLGTAVSRQVEMQYAYEERIAALRSELDRTTSQHIVQSEGVEQQLGVLLDRQAILERRQTALDILIKRARESGIDIAALEARLPRPRPGAADDATAAATNETAGENIREDVPALGYLPQEPGRAGDAAIADILEDGPSGGPHAVRATLGHVQAALDRSQARQALALEALSGAVENEVTRLSDALTPVGIAIEEIEDDARPQGGPFVASAGPDFIERAAMLGYRLDDLRSLRRSAAAMPLASPVAGRLSLSSRFGYRIDPFLKRRAFHSGLDFVAPEGTAVLATAPGIVLFAGVNGGYGNMVEIRHADGMTTRYGHLATILVSDGVEVAAGTPIGRVGSTGRSTGPHLHYETRRDGEAVNPAIFVAAGQALRGAQ